jgi:outer membrane protein TolC
VRSDNRVIGKGLERALRCLALVLFTITRFGDHAASPAVAAEDWKSDAGAGDVLLETVNVQASGKYTRAIIQSSAPLKYRHLQQEDPPVVYLYMSAPTVSKRPAIQKVYGDLVEEVRIGYKGGGEPTGDKPRAVEYILFKLTGPAKYDVTQKDWVLVVELEPAAASSKPASTSAAAPAPLPPAADDSYVPQVPQRKGKPLTVLPPDPALQDFLDVGLANNQPLQLAMDEYRLSRFRFFEASRALFPSVTGRYEESEGTLLLDPNDPTDDTDFRRKEIGVQVGQPIFQSGRLYYSLRQASMQKRISAQNVEKARAEVVLEIKKAYFTHVKAQRSLKARREALERSERVMELSRKKRQLEIITEAEALGAESQHSQIYYRKLSEEKDFEIARLKLQTLLNTPEPMPDVVPDPKGLFDPQNPPGLDVPVDSLVEQALRNRPEMIAADYTARFHAYGEKVAKSEGRLRLDVSGFVGRSGGAFSGAETLQLRSSWNVGVQAGMYLLGNSVRGTGTGEKTSPDLGETSRTKTDARTANVGFLDGLKLVSDRRQATIARERAAMERDQMRRNVETEVREAYFNLEKARLQLKGSRLELDYREKELVIARQKERMNLADPTQVLQAESSFTEAKVAYEDTISFYHVSIASLEKAVGLPLDSILGTP